MDEKRNRSFEDSIARAPSDDSLKLVYADWLLANGNRWGEFIAVQNRYPSSSPDDEFFRWDDEAGITASVRGQGIDNELYEKSSGSLSRDDPCPPSDDSADEHRLRRLFRGYALGEHSHEPIRLRWSSGFIDRVFIPQRISDNDLLPTILEGIFASPRSIALRELAIGAIQWGHGDASSYPRRAGESAYRLHVIEAIAIIGARQRTALHRLVLGAWEEHDISWTGIDDLSDLYPTLPNLRVLELQGGGIELGSAIALPELRVLALRSGGLPARAIESITASELPHLEELSVWFGDSDYGGSESVAVALPLLEASPRPSLRRLGLANAMFTDDLCDRLPSAPILAQLTHLDLSLGTMSDDGARRLLRSREAFAHLEHLDVRGNGLSGARCRELAALCKSVDSRFQDRQHRYVTVSE